jgi:hypothetical protein
MKMRGVYVHMYAKNVFGCDQSHVGTASWTLLSLPYLWPRRAYFGGLTI